MNRSVSMRGLKKPLLFLLGILCLLGLNVGSAVAQFDTGTLGGTTVDSSGALLPGASVTVSNTGTGATVTLKSNGAGIFSASDLPYGTYTVAATAPGFGTTTSSDVVLNVGAAVHLTLKLSASGTAETVTVTGTATSVNTESAVSGESFNSRQVENLPVNGRDVDAFLEISPGSVGSAPEFQGSVNGLENIFSGLNITVDGQSAVRGDITGFLNTEGQEQPHITRSSIDSIQEIDFANNGYSAETGHSLGPQMNIITKGGTNQWHGTAFEFFRNDALDARDYFDTGAKEPLQLNQFGGNLSGPIVHQKFFFFTNYEGTRQHVTTLSPLTHTLSAYVRSQFVPSMQPVLAQLAPLPAGCDVIPTPASCVYQPLASDTDAGGAQFVISPTTFPSILSEDTGSARLDWNMSGTDRWMFRYNINDSTTNDTYGPNLGQTSPQSLRTQLAKLDETHVFSSSLLNQASLGYTRFYSKTASDTVQPYYIIAGFFTDLGSLPGANTFNQTNAYSTYELFDNVTKTFHTNELKFGTQIRVNRQVEALSPLQSYQFASVSNLEDNVPFVLQKNGFEGSLGLHNSEYDFYVQDNWHVTRKLVLNLGMRYDYNTMWNEAHNHMPNFDIPTQTILSGTLPPYSEPRTDFAPRVGIAYDPFGTGKTVIHAYGGLFYLPMWLSFDLSSNDPTYASYSVNLFQVNITFPEPNPALPAGTQTVYSFPQHPKDPNALNWLFGVEQQLPGQFVAVVNYSANRVNHQQAGVNFAAINENPQNPNPNIGTRPHSGFADENYLGDVLGSNYQSLQVQLRRNYHHLDTELNYTWSHEIDDMVNVFQGFANPYNPRFDRSSGDIDVRNNFTASAVYDFSDLHGRPTWERAVGGGWQLSSIFQARGGLSEDITLVSGFFGNPVRPNYVPGQNPYLSQITWLSPVGSYNSAAFSVPTGYDGTPGENLGNVGRNWLRGPGFFQWDFSAMKTFDVSHKVKLQFRTDLFNVINHPNYSNPDGGICSALTYGAAGQTATCTPNPNFGQTFSTVANQTGSGQIGNGTARQVQFSLKLLF
jgi:Carboxypeptidase regulatory-like domain